MAITYQEIRGLLKMLRLTRSEEFSCDECLAHLAEFAENDLGGKSVSESLALVQHHLELCPECDEEYQALLVGLKNLDDSV